MPGMLFVVATPIGNLEDLTFRALRTLKEVDLIAAEDTRRTAKLLAHYEIRKPMVSLREHNEAARSAAAGRRLQQGEHLALVSATPARRPSRTRAPGSSRPVTPAQSASSRFPGRRRSPPHSLRRACRPTSTSSPVFHPVPARRANNGWRRYGPRPGLRCSSRPRTGSGGRWLI